MVDRFSWAWPAVAQTFLADMPVTFKDAGADDVPFTAVPALVAAQPSLVLLPTFIAVHLTVARTIRGRAGTTALAACARNSRWHAFNSNKKATSKCQWFGM